MQLKPLKKGTDAGNKVMFLPLDYLVFIDENNANILIEEGYHSEEDYK